jgi:hypothetical protein
MPVFDSASSLQHIEFKMLFDKTWFGIAIAYPNDGNGRQRLPIKETDKRI